MGTRLFVSFLHVKRNTFCDAHQRLLQTEKRRKRNRPYNTQQQQQPYSVRAVYAAGRAVIYISDGLGLLLICLLDLGRQITSKSKRGSYSQPAFITNISSREGRGHSRLCCERGRGRKREERERKKRCV